MKAVNLLARALLVGTAALASSAGWAQDGGDPAANWQAVVACAEQGDPDDRHACVDNVLRAAGVLDPAREIAAQRENFGEPSPEAAPPVQAAHQAPSPTPAPAPPLEIEGIETTVADALIGGDRLLVVATAEGAIWKQIDGGPFRRAPAKGETFIVEEGALGSYRCKIGSDIYRCRRLD